ncbi:DUF5325 family protein [Niallia sp. Krafla_26]|uniref:DUF5325 family protein n=1 Tax=Niallia sp. Krafla_26 TaxID=3064703 RepID=UPI003D17CA23
MEKNVKQTKGFFLLLAFLGTLCLSGLSISIAEGSLIGGLVSIVILLFTMGLGFSQKKKFQEKETV